MTEKQGDESDVSTYPECGSCAGFGTVAGKDRDAYFAKAKATLAELEAEWWALTRRMQELDRGILAQARQDASRPPECEHCRGSGRAAPIKLLDRIARHRARCGAL
jgi:4-aminobutyrate aminotransferase-like enzyme